MINLLQKRVYGIKHTKKDIEKAYKLMKLLYNKFEKNNKKLDYLINIEWKEKEIESEYGGPIWNNAHNRRIRYENNKEKYNREMFRLLTTFDGIYETFTPGYSMNPIELLEDFEYKYINGDNYA